MQLQIPDLVAYAGAGLQILLSVVLLVVALAVVRPVSATAGYLGAAAAGLHLLATCCADLGLDFAMRQSYELAEPLGYLSTAVTLVDHLAFWGLVAAAAATLAKSAPKGAA